MNKYSISALVPLFIFAVLLIPHTVFAIPPTNPADQMTFIGSPTSISPGDSANLTWSSSGTGSPGGCGVYGPPAPSNPNVGVPVNSNTTTGSASVSPTETSTYDFNCVFADGTNDSRSVTITVNGSANQVGASCAVSPTSANTGTSVTWSASATGGTAPYSYSWSGTDGLSGTGTSVSKSYSTAGTKTGTVSVVDGGVLTDTWVKSSRSAACRTVWTYPQCGQPGQPAQGSSCSTPGNTFICNPQDVYCGAAFQSLYQLQCQQSGTAQTTDTASCTVPISALPAPTVTLTASPASVVSGGSSTLTWTSSNATSASINGTAVSPVGGGSIAVTPGATTLYTITATGAGGSASASATVTVTTPLPDLVGTTNGTVTDTVGTPITLSGSVANAGAGSAGAFPNIVRVCDANCATINTLVSATAIASLAPNATAAVSGSYTPASANNLYYQVCANTNTSNTNVVTETNYANNCGNWNNLTVNPPIPAAPTNPTTTCNSSGTAVSISWSPAPGATVYYPRMYAPTSAQCSSFGWQLWTDNKTCYPNPDSYTGTSVVNFPVTPGVNYAWWVQSGNSGGSSTGSTGNNSFTCVAPPDLTSTTGANQADTVNQPITLSGTVSNASSGGPASSAFPNLIQVCNDTSCSTINTIIAANSISSLAAGASSPVSASYTPTSAGTLYYRTCANENTSWVNVIGESDYGNNCGAFQTLTVQLPLTGSCAANPSGTVPAPATITWSATASGGSGGYSYLWGGNVAGSATPVSQTYNAAGTYSGEVTITDSSGNTITQQCSPGGATTPIRVIDCTPTFTATPGTIYEGQSSALAWSIPSPSCASSCTGTGFNTGGATSGSVPVTPPATSSYALQCGAAPQLNQTVNVIVPTATITASPDRVEVGGTTSLTWSSTNTNTCKVVRNNTGATIGDGSSVSGTNVPDPTPLTKQTIYTITCSTNGNPVSATTIVNMKPFFVEF